MLLRVLEIKAAAVRASEAFFNGQVKPNNSIEAARDQSDRLLLLWGRLN